MTADRTPLAQAIFEDAQANPGGRRGRNPSRFLRWAEEHPVWGENDRGPDPTPEQESRWAFEDDADRYDPDVDVPHPGGPRWERLIRGEAGR